MRKRTTTTRVQRQPRGNDGFDRGRVVVHPLHWGGPRHSAFSMTEMVFAIFILGIGLLFTSSMFPIAWTKAREVFEASNTEATTEAGESMFRRNAKVNGRADLEKSITRSTLFPADWFPTVPHDPLVDDVQPPFAFPSTRVHAMNMGNIKAELPFADNNQELDDLKGGGEFMPVGDNGWRLSDQLVHWMGQPLELGTLTDPETNRSYFAHALAHTRLFPPMTARLPMIPANASANALWDEQFEGRRYCWSVLYRFSRMFGPDPDPGWLGPPLTVENNTTEADLERAMAEPRELTVYYVTLKRPTAARYARQIGLVGNGSAATWNDNGLDEPRAMPSSQDVLLPTPWRFKASLISPPVYGGTPSGIPSEILVSDSAAVLANMLAPKTTLIDDRNGQVYRVTQRRDVTGNPNEAVLVLDKEYAYRDIYLPRHVTFPDVDELEDNWTRQWHWEKMRCAELDLTDTSDPIVGECRQISVFASTYDDLRSERYYWVFPPPVEAVRAAPGVPVFAGSPPVVEVKTRQVILRPRP